MLSRRNVALLTLAILGAAVPDATPDIPVVLTAVNVTIPLVAPLDGAGELDDPGMTEADETVAIIGVDVIAPGLITEEVAGVFDPMKGPPPILPVSVSLSALTF